MESKIIDISAITYSKKNEGRLIGIYKITSPTGKIYIGQSSNVINRFFIYKKLHCKKQIYLYNSFIKHGVNNHKFEIIEICSEEKLNELEIYYSNIYKSTDRDFGLNLRECGGHAKISDESRKKLSVALLGKKKSDEARVNMSKAKKGIKPYITGKRHSNETKYKMSASKIGKPSKLKGIPLSEETKSKIRESSKGRKAWNKGIKMNESQVEKMRKPKSLEARANMSKAKKGKKLSDEHKKNIGGKPSHNKGKKASAETVLKQSESSKLAWIKRKKEGTDFHTGETKKAQSEARKKYWENIRQERALMIF